MTLYVFVKYEEWKYGTVCAVTKYAEGCKPSNRFALCIFAKHTEQNFAPSLYMQNETVCIKKKINETVHFGHICKMVLNSDIAAN
jgi:hypothetical protein